MAKGFFKGVAWGTGLSICALLLVSVADNGRIAVREEVADAAPAPQVDAGKRTGDDGPSAAGLVAPDVPAPEPDTLAGLLSETISPAAVPQAGSASALNGAEAPGDGALTGIATPSANAPQVTYTDTGSLKTPATEPGVSVSTEPAQPVAPNPVPQSSAFATPEQPETPDPQASSDDVSASDDTASQTPDDVEQQPSVALDPSQPALPPVETETSGLDPKAAEEIETELEADAQVEQADNQAAQPAELAALAPSPNEDGPASVVTEAPAQPSAEQVTSGAVRPAGPENDAPETAEALDLPAPETSTQATTEGESTSAQVEAELSVGAPRLDAPQEGQGAAVAQIVEAAPNPQVTNTLPDLSSDSLSVAPEVADSAAAPVSEPSVESESPAAVRVNRLPTLGGEPEEDAPVEEEVAALPEAEVSVDVPPIERFAATFENPEEKPLLAVILMDDGVDLSALPTGLSTVRDLPYPVSFAVDALLPDAPERMRTFRDAGFEVLAMVDLPEGARAADAEVNLSAALDAMPEVVGVLDGVRTGVQTTPDAGQHVAQILAQSGHGFVTQNRGLNTVQKLAARQGVPSAVIFRDFDAKGQSSTVIRRFLDQAAFRARQEGAVVMLGRLREETLAALVLWTLQDRASSVAMAPVSDALTLGQ